MTPSELRERLFELRDLEYREFHLKTCPQAQHVIGVRVPEQRKFAKVIIRNNPWQFLDEIQPYHYEEVLITGIVIASAPMGINERIDYAAWFVPMINNWAICDTFCNSFKVDASELPILWNYIAGYKTSSEEYLLRFMVVMMLSHFQKQEYLPMIFNIIDNIKSDKYYVEMAKAWLVADLFIKFRKEVLEYLQHDQLSIFAHNKSIQKACESRRISIEDKQILRGMKL